MLAPGVIANVFSEIKRLHAETMGRLLDAIAVSRGVRSFSAADDATKRAVVAFAIKLCKAWNNSPRLRENEVGDSIIICRVAEQFALAQAITAAERDIAVAASETCSPESCDGQQSEVRTRDVRARIAFGRRLRSG